MEGFSPHTQTWIHSGYKPYQTWQTNHDGTLVTSSHDRGRRPPVLQIPGMDPRGGMSYQPYKTQVSHQRGHQALRSGPPGARPAAHGARPAAHMAQQNVRASSKGSSSRPSPQAMRPGKPSPQTVRRSAASSSQQSSSRAGVTQGSLLHGRPNPHIQSTLHGHVQRQQPGHVQRQPGHLSFPQNTRSELFHFHSTPATHSMPQTLEKRAIQSRASAAVGEMPLDLSRQAPVRGTSSTSKGAPKASSASASSSALDSPLDLSGKSSAPINLGKKNNSGTSSMIHVQKCSFCNASFSTIPFLKMHLGKCPRKPKNLTNVDIDRWIENNFPEAIPSSSREKPKDDILDNLPRVNGAVALGTICIKEEPNEEEDISIIDIQPIGKSVDKSVYKSSAKKSSSASSGKSTTSEEAPPPVGYIKYACIYCDKTYDRKDMLQEHIKSHSGKGGKNSSGSSNNSSSNSSQNTSRPVLTQGKQKSSQAEITKPATSKNDKEPASVLSVPQPPTSSKSPDAKPAGTDTRRSATPTRSSEKKQVKRQTGNIMSIADNLLRRMTEKTQHSEKSDNVVVAEEEAARTSPVAEKIAPAEVPAKKNEEAPKKPSEEKAPEKEVEEKEEIPAKEDGETEKESSESLKPSVVEPKEPVKAKPAPAAKSNKASKKSTEKVKAKTKATPKSQKKAEKEAQKITEEKTTKAPAKKKEVRRTRESVQKESMQETPEAVSTGKKGKEGNKKTAQPEKTESPPKITKPPVKDAEKVDSEVEKKTRTEKQAKSPTRKTAKAEKMTREKAADIAKLALDLGCLRRSPRAAKADSSGLPSPTQPLVEDHVEVMAPSPSKKTKPAKSSEKEKLTTPPAAKQPLVEDQVEVMAPSPSKKTKPAKSSEKEKLTTPPATPTRKASKRALELTPPTEPTPTEPAPTESLPTEPPAKKSKKDVVQEVVKEVEEEKNKKGEAVAIKSKGKSKEAKQTKGKKGGKKAVEKRKKKVASKKGNTQGIEKFFEKKSTSSKSATEVFSDHVAKMKPTRSRSKVAEKSVDEEVVEEQEAEEPPTLQDAEMEAVEELMKLSRGTTHQKMETDGAATGKNKENKEKTKSESQDKIDDIYNRHVAAIKGKVTKKGRSKKKKQKSKVRQEDDEPEKLPRIVGRKAYKEWLESQATAKDKSGDISKKKELPKTNGGKSSKEKKKKRYEDDEDDYMMDLHDENDMDDVSDLDDKDEGNDRNWEPELKSAKFSASEEFELECSKCKAPVTGRKDFNKHMLCHSPVDENTLSDARIFSCPVCTQQFRNKSRCWGHMVREHAGLKSFHQCPYCFKKYSRRDAVQVHVASVHPKERRRELAEKNGWQPKEEEEEEEFKDEDVDVDLTCKRCNRPIQNKGDCYTHIMLHSPRGKRKVCPLCDKTSKDSSRVWEHVMVEHAGIKPFGCDQCSYRCAHEENLKKHIQTYHGKFLDPVARVKMDFESENWDLGINPSYLHEPHGPLPLSSGSVISLIELSLNTLIINQRTKVMNLNMLLSGQNMNLRTIINEALEIGIGGPEENGAASTSKPQAKAADDGLKKGDSNNNNDDDDDHDDDEEDDNDGNDNGDKGNEVADREEEIYPDDPAVIASNAMIPADCVNMELPCVLCPMGVKGADEFKLHVLKHICDSTRICPVCRRAFSRKSSCRRHLVEHTFKWTHKCNLCSQTFPKSQYLEKHYSKHVEQGFQCLNCLGKFEGEEELWMHIHPKLSLALRQIPLGAADNVKFSCRRVHVCEKCHQEFRSAWGLQYHRENTHSEGPVEEEKPFVCMTCGKRFKSNITLKNHQEIHVEDCTYHCRHCGLTCRTKRQLQKHIEYKHMEKIYKCSYCPKMFATRSRLKEHAIMHQNKTFICDICGKVYRHQRVFETHCRQHIKPPVKKHRLFPCPQCTHQSKSKEQLNLHMRRHTGERPYKCKECPKAFSSQTGLWRHQMSHAGRKPHECHLCKKSFVQKCSLDRHLLSHAGIKPYRCEYCGAEYSQSYPLTKHMEKRHPGMPFIIIKKDVDPIVIEPRATPPQQPVADDSVAEVAAKAAKIATSEAINSLPGVAPAANVVCPVPASALINDVGDGEEEEPKEFLSV